MKPLYALTIMILAGVLPIMVAAQNVRRTRASVSIQYQNAPIRSGEQITVYEWDNVDTPPHFPGGQRGLLNYINSTREYPREAYQNRIEGRVLCSFVINPDGSVSDVRILRGIEDSLNAEALRIISGMPTWKAGEIGNRPVHVHCIVPIIFRL